MGAAEIGELSFPTGAGLVLEAGLVEAGELKPRELAEEKQVVSDGCWEGCCEWRM